jgi:hypothetical protein
LWTADVEEAEEQQREHQQEQQEEEVEEVDRDQNITTAVDDNTRAGAERTTTVSSYVCDAYCEYA